MPNDSSTVPDGVRRVVKYEQLGIPYKLEGVPQMDTARMPELRNAVMTGMKKRRAELKNAID